MKKKPFFHSGRLPLLLLLTALLVAPLLFSGCSSDKDRAEAPDSDNTASENGLTRFSKNSLETFDTLTVISGFDTDEAAFEEKAALLLEVLAEYHKLYDIYHSYEGISNLKTINDNAGIAPVAVDERIIDLLEYAVEMYELTGGKTNVAMGSVLKLWHRCRSQAADNPELATLPEQEALDAAAAHTDIDNLIIDREAGTVYLADSEMSLDVGAVAKGYTTDRLADIIRENGWNHIALSIGGNVKTIGPKGNGESWRVGIQTPDSSWEQSYFCLLALDDLSLVTSGSYQRHFTVDGKRYHHIINPDTLWPENNFLSLSIICESSALGDVLSTALFNMSQEDGEALLEALPDVEAVWVYEDGEYVFTPGLSKILLTDADK